MNSIFNYVGTVKLTQVLKSGEEVIIKNHNAGTNILPLIFCKSLQGEDVSQYLPNYLRLSDDVGKLTEKLLITKKSVSADSQGYMATFQGLLSYSSVHNDNGLNVRVELCNGLSGEQDVVASFDTGVQTSSLISSGSNLKIEWVMRIYNHNVNGKKLYIPQGFCGLSKSFAYSLIGWNTQEQCALSYILLKGADNELKLPITNKLLYQTYDNNYYLNCNIAMDSIDKQFLGNGDVEMYLSTVDLLEPPFKIGTLSGLQEETVTVLSFNIYLTLAEEE